MDVYNIAASFTRPNDTTAYAIGDLVANSTTAGSVVALSFNDAVRNVQAHGIVRKLRIVKSGTGTTGSSFRLHLYSSSPTVTNGDNGAWLSTGAATYLGALEASVDRVFSDGSAGTGTPMVGSEISFDIGGGTLFGLLEARAAYAPAANEVFTLTLEVMMED